MFRSQGCFLASPRLASRRVDRALARSPAVAILGSRQVGKTTLARAAAAARPGSVYLDLETAADQARLADAARFLGSRRDRLVVLEVVHMAQLLLPEVARRFEDIEGLWYGADFPAATPRPKRTTRGGGGRISSGTS